MILSGYRAKWEEGLGRWEHRINIYEWADCRHSGRGTTGGTRDRAKEWGYGRMRQSSEEVLNQIVLGDSPGVLCTRERAS